MKDLEYIIGVGFTGEDLPRAVILAFLFAMFARKDTNVWTYALFALLIDRTVWPIATMGASGADVSEMYAALGKTFSNFWDDIGLYFVRYMGLVLMILGFGALRGFLQKFVPGKTAHA